MSLRKTNPETEMTWVVLIRPYGEPWEKPLFLETEADAREIAQEGIADDGATVYIARVMEQAP